MGRSAFRCVAQIGLALCLCLSGCGYGGGSPVVGDPHPDVHLLVLGVAQDAGYPQAGCMRRCCAAVYEGGERERSPVSLALVDHRRDAYWLFESTPAMGRQLRAVGADMRHGAFRLPAGVFLTHAHVGHYAGLAQFGREVMGAGDVPVHVMPRMDSFLRGNGPWSQLVALRNIRLSALRDGSALRLTDSLEVTPLRVPHRDEYSETVGFLIRGMRRRVLFIPDIDKWERWDRNIDSLVAGVDAAFLDGTFHDAEELPGRDMREIPHPSVRESMARFAYMPDSLRSRVYFIHFNHTNPLLRRSNPQRDSVLSRGFSIAEEGLLMGL